MESGQPPAWSSIEGKACLLNEFWVEVDEWIEPCSVISVGEGGRVFREGHVLCELSAFVWGKKHEKTYSVHVLVLMCVPVLMHNSHPHACSHSCPHDRSPHHCHLLHHCCPCHCCCDISGHPYHCWSS